MCCEDTHTKEQKNLDQNVYRHYFQVVGLVCRGGDFYFPLFTCIYLGQSKIKNKTKAHFVCVCV